MTMGLDIAVLRSINEGIYPNSLARRQFKMVRWVLERVRVSMETSHSFEEIKVSPLSLNGSLASMLLQIDGASRCKSDIIEEALARDSFKLST
jgi:hypothetical protein